MRKQKQAQHLLSIAHHCIEKSNYSQAIKLLQQVTELDPTLDEGYRLLADSLEELGETAEAEKNYLLCLEYNPVSVICYTNYGLMLYKIGRKT